MRLDFRFLLNAALYVWGCFDSSYTCYGLSIHRQISDTSHDTAVRKNSGGGRGGGVLT